jgi:membrane-associated protease RseP (regulator of RpoE activity)
METTKQKALRLCALALAAAVAAPALAGAQIVALERAPLHQIRVNAPARARVVIGNAGRAWLGIQMVDINEELRAFYGAPEDAGLLVSRVEEDSPAAAAGLEVGDVLTGIDGEPVASSRDAIRAVARLEPEAAVALDVVRNGAPLTLNATLDEREELAWFSHDFDMPEFRGMFFLGENDGEAVVESEEAAEAVREAVERARERMSEIDFSEMTEEAMRDAIEQARERMSEFDFEALRERLAEAEDRLRELEKKLAERER